MPGIVDPAGHGKPTHLDGRFHPDVETAAEYRDRRDRMVEEAALQMDEDRANGTLRVFTNAAEIRSFLAALDSARQGDQ